jgi:hypothetical protein
MTIVTEWPKLYSLNGDSSATLEDMTVQTIPEYLEEERQKAADTQLRTEEEAARVQPGHHRKAKRPRRPLLPQVKAITKKKRKTVAVARKKPRAAKKMAANTRKRA